MRWKVRSSSWISTIGDNSSSPPTTQAFSTTMARSPALKGGFSRNSCALIRAAML